MQDVAGAWLMTSLAPSPVMVALLQTAMNLPFFLLALPAGALSDLLDRRVILFASQIWIMLAVLALGLLTMSGAMTPWLLLTLIVLVGTGCAVNSPAFNSLAPDLVTTGEIEAAIAIIGAGFNLMRGLGGVIGGVLVGKFGAGVVFLLNALSMVCVLFVLLKLKKPVVERTSPPENVIGAMKAGMRYLAHSHPLHAVLLRTTAFAAFTSCMWALLPLLAREKLHMNAAEYGIALSIFGVGTVGGAIVLPALRRTLSQDGMCMIGTLLVGSCMAMLAVAPSFAIACVALLGGGIGWITGCAALNASVLSASPAWVRARVLAVYLLVFQGCFAFGSLAWGFVAKYSSMPFALQAAAGALVGSLVLALVYPLKVTEKCDFSTSSTQVPPDLPLKPHPEHGPVVISVEYLIESERLEEFNQAIAELEVKRRRDGAFRWNLFSDLARPGIYVEMFYLESWGEYLRQRERSTIADERIEERAASLHAGSSPPKVSHYISEKRRSRPTKTRESIKIDLGLEK